MTRDAAYENQCYRRRNAAVAATRHLAIVALSPKNLQAETDRSFQERKQRALSSVETTPWMGGFFVNIGDAGFTKAQEKVLIADLTALFPNARVSVRRATRTYKRFVEVSLGAHLSNLSLP